MTKKTIIIIALLLACVCIFACCAKESFKFDALKVDAMEGELTSNGGVSVSYKGYTYFINGDVGKFDIDNTFGKVKYGAICRIKTEYILDDSFVDLDIGSAEYNTKTENKVEILAPKAYFNNNTATNSLNGLFIFSDRLYYTTPSTTTDKNGAVQNTFLDIMSVKLDGTDTKRLYTVNSNTYEMMLSQVGDKVYASYVNENKLYCINLFDAKPQAEEIVDNVSAYKFDVNSGKIALTLNIIVKKENQATEITLKYNTINLFTPGDEKVTLVLSGERKSEQDVSYDVSAILQRIQDNYIYFAVTNDAHGRDGIYRIGTDQRDVMFSTVTPETNATFKKMSTQNLLENGILYKEGQNEYIIFYNSSEKYIQLFNIANGNVSNLLYTTSAPTFVGINNGKLFYTAINLYYVTLTEGEQDSGIMLSTITNAVSWAGFDIYDDYVLYMAATENSDVYLSSAKIIDKGEDIQQIFIGIYSEQEEE